MSEEDDQVSREEFNKVNNKLEVAKSFLKELDDKVSKYESLGIPELLDQLKKYESLGSVKELIKLKSESKQMSNAKGVAKVLLSKLESDEVEKKDLLLEEKTTKEELEKDIEKNAENLKLEENEKEADEYDDEDLDELDPDEIEDSELKVEAVKKKLKAYQALGSLSDIRKCLTKTESFLDIHGSFTDVAKVLTKSESLLDRHTKVCEKLESYEELGSVEDILQVCNEYASIKTKQESARISQKLRIPLEKVEATIEKMESVREAEQLLTDLFGTANQKSESDDLEKVESAEVVTEKTNTEKQKAESGELTTLRQICRKL